MEELCDLGSKINGLLNLLRSDSSHGRHRPNAKKHMKGKKR